MKRKWVALLLAVSLTALQAAPVYADAADINITGVKAAPVIRSLTPENASVESGGTVEFTILGENLTEQVGIKVSDLLGNVAVDVQYVENTDSRQVVKVTFPANTTEWAKAYTVQIYGNKDLAGDVLAETTVKVGDKQADAAIYRFEADKTSTEGEEPEKVTFTVYGEGLLDHVGVGVFLNGVKQTMPAEFHEEECTQTKQVFSIEFPANNTKKDQVYEVKTTAEKGSDQWFGQSVKITVKGEGSGPVIEETSVDEISSSAIGTNGLTYRISFSGKNMSEEKLNIQVEPFDEVFITEKSIGKTEGSFLVTFPENKSGEDIRYQVSVGAKSGETAPKTLEFVIESQEGDEREEIDLKPTSAVIDETYQIITLTFDQPVFNACESLDKLKEKISLKMGFAERSLEQGDKIQIDEGRVVIELAEQYKPLFGGLGINVKEGALCTAEDKVLKPFSWVVDDGAQVLDIQLSKEVLEWEGGEVTAKLQGYHLKDAKIEGKIIDVRTSRENPDIPVQVEYDEGGMPYLRFTAPRNESDTTQGWLLKLTVNGVPVSDGLDYKDIAKRPLVSVLPKDAEVDDITLGNMTVNSYGVNPDPDNLQYTETSTNQESKKIQVHLYGSNLDASKTKVKIVDEDGVEWPIYNVPQFDSVWYFIMVGNDGTGITGNGNHQILEIICPRNIATDRKYQIYISVDGEEFIMDQSVTVCVTNRGEQGLAQPVKRTVTVQHVDENGAEIADSDELIGYSWFFMADMGVAPKEIAGYHAVEVPVFEELKDTIGDADRVEKIVYAKDEEEKPEENPGDQKPGEEKPGYETENNKPGEGTGNGNGENADKEKPEQEKGDSPKTGDKAEPFGAMAGVAAAIGIAAAGWKRRKQRQ